MLWTPYIFYSPPQIHLFLAAVSGLQTQWTVAYSAWQNANAFNFGPAGESGLKLSLLEEIGTFPVDNNKIEALISAQDFSTLLALYDTLKKHVHLFGSDMSSVLGIAITFDSGDGD